jgi:DUF4097 and DUF4098 domain-containing protein YvlB
VASWKFPVTGPVTAHISLPAGWVQVTAKPTDTVSVQLSAASEAGESLLEQTEVRFDDGTLRVRVPQRVTIRGNASLDLTVELPEGSSVRAETASADVTLAGRLAAVEGKTASGDVQVDRVTGNVDLTTASGDIRIEDAAGEVRVSSASGDTAIGQAGGDIIAKTASGDVQIGQAGQSVTLKTASGDVRLASVHTGRTDVTTVSGDVTVGVVPDVEVYLDISTLSGDISSELDSSSPTGETAASLTLSCRTVSGDIRVTRAR